MQKGRRLMLAALLLLYFPFSKSRLTLKSTTPSYSDQRNPNKGSF